MGGKQPLPMTGGKVGVSQTVNGKEKEGGVEGKRAPMTVFKDRNLVLTGKKNGVSERRGQDGENDTFGEHRRFLGWMVADFSFPFQASRN